MNNGRIAASDPEASKLHKLFSTKMMKQSAILDH